MANYSPGHPAASTLSAAYSNRSSAAAGSRWTRLTKPTRPELTDSDRCAQVRPLSTNRRPGCCRPDGARHDEPTARPADTRSYNSAGFSSTASSSGGSDIYLLAADEQRVPIFYGDLEQPMLKVLRVPGKGSERP
jgi:hypothetical protein